jgi:hypothetical protein
VVGKKIQERRTLSRNLLVRVDDGNEALHNFVVFQVLENELGIDVKDLKRKIRNSSGSVKKRRD